MITRSGSLLRRAAARSLAHIASGSTSDLARQMPAPLGKLLVFELNRRRAGRFQLDDRPLDVQRLAEARVGIDDQRQGAGPREIGRLLGQLA